MPTYTLKSTSLQNINAKERERERERERKSVPIPSSKRMIFERARARVIVNYRVVTVSIEEEPATVSPSL